MTLFLYSDYIITVSDFWVKTLDDVIFEVIAVVLRPLRATHLSTICIMAETEAKTEEIFRKFYPKLLEILPMDRVITEFYSKQLLSSQC